VTSGSSGAKEIPGRAEGVACNGNTSAALISQWFIHLSCTRSVDDSQDEVCVSHDHRSRGEVAT